MTETKALPGSRLMAEEMYEDIPATTFIEDVEVYLTKNKLNTDEVIKGLDENHRKYMYTQNELRRGRGALQAKIPEITKNIETVKFLISKEDEDEPLAMKYSLADHVFGHAKLTKKGTVFLWLGAKTMVEYTYEEALAMLETSLEKTKESLTRVDGKLDFIKDQITTLEVNTSRVFNYSIKFKREAAAAEAQKNGAKST